MSLINSLTELSANAAFNGPVNAVITTSPAVKYIHMTHDRQR